MSCGASSVAPPVNDRRRLVTFAVASVHVVIAVILAVTSVGSLPPDLIDEAGDCGTILDPRFDGAPEPIAPELLLLTFAEEYCDAERTTRLLLIAATLGSAVATIPIARRVTRPKEQTE